MNKIHLKTGVVTGVLASIACMTYLIVVQLFGANPLAQLKFLMYTGVYALFFIGVMKYQRDHVNTYTLGAQEGIMLGIIVNATAAMLTGTTLYLYLEYTTLGNELFAMHQKDLMALLEAAKSHIIETMGEESFQTTLVNLQASKTTDYAGDLSIGLMVAGLFHTFLFMLIFKTKSS